MYPSYVTEYAGMLYFRGSTYPRGTNTELWRSDGQTAERVADIVPGENGSNPGSLVVYNGKLYFNATGTTGGVRLWQYDPVGGAQMAPGSTSQASLPEAMTVFNGQLYYRATRFGAPSNIGTELWRFDGTTQTPLDVYAGSGSSYPQHFTLYNGLLYFNACGTPGQGSELWRYDGTGMPEEAARIYPDSGSSPEHMAVYSGSLYFSAYDGVHGRELWRFDGTQATLAADIAPGGPYASSNPSNLVVYRNKLSFCADDGVHGNELWSFDGAQAQMVAEINPTPDPGNGDTFLMDSSPANFVIYNDVLYFSADDGVHGRELWSYDGTTVRLALDINPGPYGSGVTELTVFNGRLFFSADAAYVPGLYSFQPVAWSLDFRQIADADGDGVSDLVDECPNTVPGAIADLVGCPAVIKGDGDHDGDVDFADLAAFLVCFSGPDVQRPADCTAKDFDRDEDVDQRDFGVFQRCFSGANQPAAIACGA
jgi:ELWxxDGT repeat protein